MANVADYLTGDLGSIFVQPDGPNGDVYWLGCHDLGDVAEPSGDVSRTFCPDPSGRGKWKISTRAQGAAQEGTVDISFPVGKTADWLEIIGRRRCPTAVYVNSTECGERDVFNDFDRGFVLQNALVTNKTRSSMAMRGSDGAAPTEATRTFSFSFERAEDYFSLVATRYAHASVVALSAITSAGRDRCLGACGAPSEPCDLLWAVEDAAAGAAVVWYSTDAGATWTASGADPFAVTEGISSITSFAINATTMRVLVPHSTTLALTPAEIAYTDSATGAAWTSVTVGATDTEFINDVFAWSQEAVYACTDTGGGAAGNVYKSVDGGATWTIVLAGATDALNAITFGRKNLGLAVGDTNEIQFTEDGGDHWTSIAGPAAQAAVNCLDAAVLDAYRWFVTYDDGTLWYTQDGGTTWTQRAIPLPTGATAIPTLTSIQALDEYCIWIGGTATVGGNPFAFLARSVNGGKNWASWLSPTTSVIGTADLTACTYNQAYAAGGLAAATGLILAVAETS